MLLLLLLLRAHTHPRKHAYTCTRTHTPRGARGHTRKHLQTNRRRSRLIITAALRPAHGILPCSPSYVHRGTHGRVDGVQGSA